MKIALISTSLNNIGVRSLSSFLKTKGHEARLYLLYSPEREYDISILEDLKTRLSDYNLIGFSATAISFRKTLQIINYVKILDIPIVLGGIHPTLDPESFLQYVDMVCLGEGEEAMAELAERIEKRQVFYDVRNFYFKKGNGQIIRNPVRPLIQDLDSLPFPDYDAENHFIISNGKLRKLERPTLDTDHPSVEHQNSIFIYTVRGCPYRCIYCHNRKVMDLYSDYKQQFVRVRSAASIVQELSILKRKIPELSYIYFMDDDFFVRNLAELEAFTVEYKREIGLPFWAYCTPKSLNVKKMELLIEAGLQTISMGIQSGSNLIEAEVYDRKMFKDKVLQAAEILNSLWSKHKKQLELPVYDIIINNPIETEEDILRTIQLLRKLPKPFIASFHSLVFFPGTDFYTLGLEKEVIDKDYHGWEFNFHETLEHLKIHRKNIYLNSLLYWMNWKINRWRWGLVPAFLVPILISKPLRKLGKIFELLVYLFDFIVPTKTRLFFLIRNKAGRTIWRKLFTKD